MFYKIIFFCLFYVVSIVSSQLDFRNGIIVCTSWGTRPHYQFLRETEEAKELQNSLFGQVVIHMYNQFMNGNDRKSFVDLLERGYSGRNPFPLVVRQRARELFNVDWGKKCDYHGYEFLEDGTIFERDPITIKGGSAMEEFASHVVLKPPYTPA